MPWGRLPTRTHEPKEEYKPEPGNDSSEDDGAFKAGVYVVKRQLDDRKCVEKRFGPAEVKNGAAHNEIFVLKNLNHKHVIEYIDSFLDKSGQTPRASIYMEYCDLGSLADVLEERRTAEKPPKEWAVWDLFIQLTNAVAYCYYGIHDAVFKPRGKVEADWTGCLHRDIKPANIFLRSDGRSKFPRAVLGGFGNALVMKNDGHRQREHTEFDRNWAPPEAPRYACVSDMWSIGIVIQAFCRLETNPPTSGPRKFLGAGADYTHELNETIRYVMHSNPRDRPTADVLAPDLPEARHQALKKVKKTKKPPPKPSVQPADEEST
ncbi:hypothetical protein MMC07_003875 [Pseudocyphellaria aurata]|nr:hypothetical protein [Pseudocyphellaria aurata]